MFSWSFLIFYCWLFPEYLAWSIGLKFKIFRWRIAIKMTATIATIINGLKVFCFYKKDWKEIALQSKIVLYYCWGLLWVRLLVSLQPCNNGWFWNLESSAGSYIKTDIFSITETTVELFFFYLGFLSQTFTNHRTAAEGGGHFFNPSLPLPPATQTLRH